MTARDPLPAIPENTCAGLRSSVPLRSAVVSPAVSGTLWARGLKRATDLLLSTIGLLVVSPVLVVAMLAVKMSSPGPVFFRQVRTGRDGREFRPFKLRTMRGGRRADPNETVPLDHPEVTAVGRLLRRLKLDELPQILNVVKGDMALVGPRPTLPDQTRRYNEFERARLAVRPGLTGLAQVNGNTALTWPERIEYDVYYVRNHGFRMDLGILLKTVLVISRGEARYARRFAQSPYAWWLEAGGGAGQISAAETRPAKSNAMPGESDPARGDGAGGGPR